MVLGGVGTFLFLIAFCFLAVGTLALFGAPDKNINFISPLMVLAAVVFFMLSFAAFVSESGATYE